MTNTGPDWSGTAGDPNSPSTDGTTPVPVEDATFGLSQELAKATVPVRLEGKGPLNRQTTVEAIRSMYGMSPDDLGALQQQLVDAGLLEVGRYTPKFADKATENAWRQLVVTSARSNTAVADEMDRAIQARQAAGLGPEAVRRRSRTGALGGSLADTAAQNQELRTLAGDYLTPISDATINHWISSGATKGDFENYLRGMAKGRFADPNVQQAIDRGISPKMYFEPLVQAAARELEVAPDSINLTDNKWSALTGVRDEKGQIRAMTMNEAQTFARNQPEWQHTSSALDMASRAAEGIAKQWGALG